MADTAFPSDSALALAVVHLAMIFYEAKQRGSSALWLFRLVRRPSGRYLVTKCAPLATQLAPTLTPSRNQREALLDLALHRQPRRLRLLQR